MSDEHNLLSGTTAQNLFAATMAVDYSNTPRNNLPSFPQARSLVRPENDKLLQEINKLIIKSSATTELTASNSVTKKGSWMRVYDGLFNPEFGIARGYQCPAVAKDGKPASRVKDKFVKEWGPAAQMQLERDKAENRQTFEGVKILSELFESYNQLCADDAETKKKEKEKDQLYFASK